MAQKVLIMGESGTGKSTSLRNCDPATTAVVNPVGKPLPFKGSGKFTMLNGEVDAGKVTKWMKAQVKDGKKLIVVDDFQYMLAVPYMSRIKEGGWDKWNDFGANYYEMIEVCNSLPDDVIVVYMTHLETLDTGLTTVKLIGKLLREKITIEGLFTIVLRTGCFEAKYYFYTQNSGKDTVKSPMGMFPSYAIDNDLAYVVDKIRNYYELGEYKSDTEMAAEDKAAAATDAPKAAAGRKPRAKKTKPEEEDKLKEYMDEVQEAIDAAAGEADELPFAEAADAMESVGVPKRTRAERSEPKYYYVGADDNYVMKQAGDAAPDGGVEITKEEFHEGVRKIATAETQPAVTSGRRRRTRA